jgi:hypothetical protein
MVPFPQTTTPLKTILGAGLLAGALDILAAFTQAYVGRGTSPGIVLQYIASGALGRTAFDGGLWTVFAGLLFHLAIATSWTAVFFFAYPYISVLRKSRIASGIGYGVFVWLMMNLIVVPMSRIAARPFVLENALIGVVILMVMVGLPIAFIVHNYYSRRNKSEVSAASGQP